MQPLTEGTELCTDSASNDEQVGPDEPLEFLEEAQEVRGPLFPTLVVVLLGPGGSELLGFGATNDEVAVLCVRYESPVNEHGGADTRAERDHHCHAGLIRTGAETHLGEPSSVGIVDHCHRPSSEMVGEQALGVRADPLGMEVGGGRDDALIDDAGEPEPDLTLGSDVIDELGDGDTEQCWSRGVRRGDVLSIADENSSFEVDRRGLDPGASNVHSESDGHCRRRPVR